MEATVQAQQEAQQEAPKETLYRTCDLYFSAYLCALDYPLVTAEPEMEHGKRKLYFVFRLSRKDLPRLKALFFGGGGTIKALKLVEAIKNLKSLCHV